MNSASTQSNIPIAGIKDGIVILHDGQYRIVLEITAINFELKSEQEQNSIIFQYQSFVNSLHFPIQVVIQSKKLDLSPYLKKIKDLAKKQTNELLQIQTSDYADFIEQLINLANIMKKRFYVSVGYQPIIANSGLLDKFFKKNDSSTKLKISENDYNNYSKELRQRAQTVAQGLGSMGLHCRQLNTQEIIELFYEIYNPEIASKERLTDSNEVSGSYYSQIKPTSGQTGDQETSNLVINNVTPAEDIIDNNAMVVAQQQQKNREIAAENAKNNSSEQSTNDDAVSSGAVQNNSAKGIPPTMIGSESGSRGFDQSAETVGVANDANNVEIDNQNYGQ